MPPNIGWNLSAEHNESGLFSYNGFEMDLNVTYENVSNVLKSDPKYGIQKKMRIFLKLNGKSNNCKNSNFHNDKLKIFNSDKTSKYSDGNFNEFDFIFTIYFQIKLNGKEIGDSNLKIKNFNPISEKMILLCEQIIDIQKLQEAGKNILNISLRMDFIYGLGLTFLSRNIEKLLQCPNIKNINELDLLSIIKNSNKNSNQEKLLLFLNRMSIDELFSLLNI